MSAESDERGKGVAATASQPATGDVTASVHGGREETAHKGVAEAAESTAEEEPQLGSRAPEFIQRSRTLHVSWQVGVFVVGLAVVGAGAAMLVLPGPGWLVIFAGMAIWATEFVWAQIVLRWTKRKVTEAAHRALDPRVRRRNIILTVVGLVVAAALLAVYVWKFGIVMPWGIG
ncbi:TIGR02611 family protein [Streptomyces sp. HNM0663]|uniref:TIGR02611 family protein n=1 Tax=Streptomyces chengmaiensis TaxID=3040919 RepID=A0ABT6HWQ4_9ACTN|nr:TIGR02611 family protein [Streptomyces chengmaiensis]MDH2392284.1 TIGR02611 family protein [Streptomyces chengmaiensis]